MKTKLIKILSLIILSAILILTFCQIVNAWTPNYNAVTSQTASNTENAVYGIMGSVIQIIKVAGTGIAIIMLIVLGIKYMVASPEGRAEYKKTMPPYVIGAIILFAASNLVSILQAFASGISNSI